MRRILKSFRWNTGLGADALPPRAVAELDDEGIEMLIDIIMKTEAVGSWPTITRVMADDHSAQPMALR